MLTVAFNITTYCEKMTLNRQENSSIPPLGGTRGATLIKTLRWFGRDDNITLREIAQTGATGIVTALHHIPNGEVWSVDEILSIKNEIEKHGLTWEVVESLPVSEGIKQGTPDRDKLIDNYIQSMQNLAECGLKTICYNFMPVLDWARTDLHYTLPNGAEAMFFSTVDFAAFDIFILKRPNAEKSYPEEIVNAARLRFEKMSAENAETLAYNIIVVTQGFIDGVVDGENSDYKKVFLNFLKKYDHIDKKQLRNNLAYFLNKIIPVAEETGMKMAIHPDDPPFPLLGLPRIMSNREDFRWLAETVPSVSNGITLCAGSLSASAKNNIPEMAELFGDRIHFVHLRSTKRFDNGDFYEDSHLEGDVDIVKVIHALYKTMQKTGRSIPVRPDHGHKLLDDFNRDANPGYPLIGRLKGLSEIAGVEKAVRYFSNT